MTAELWFEKYHGVAAGWSLWGECAACSYKGPTDHFAVWHRGDRHRVLCLECSDNIRRSMRHEHWELEKI